MGLLRVKFGLKDLICVKNYISQLWRTLNGLVFALAKAFNHCLLLQME